MKGLTLKETSGWARIHFFTQELIYAFKDSYYSKNRSRHTNLCPMMRGILLWMPSILFLQVTFWSMVIFTLVFPFILFPATAVGMFFIKLILAGLALGLLVFIVWHLFDAPKFVYNKVKTFVNDDNSVLVQYIRAKHAKICPKVEIVEPKNEEKI